MECTSPKEIWKMTLTQTKPVLSVITEKRNGPLIAAVAQLWIKPDDLVLDATWGRGGWHTDYKHPEALLIKHDKYTLDGVDYHDLPEGDSSIDVVMLDIPYTSAGNVEKSTLGAKNDCPGVSDFHDRYGITSQKGYRAIFEDMAGAITECARVLNRGGRLLVKLSDYVESGHMRWAWRNADDAATGAGLRHADEFIHHSGTGAQPKENLDGSPRRQVHSRRAHSFLEVYVKP
jgi:hypothetical protein